MVNAQENHVHVSWMTRGASMFEALISVTCLRERALDASKITVFIQDVGEGSIEAYEGILDWLKSRDVAVSDSGAEGFGDDLWQALPYLGLRQFSDVPFAVFDPGTLFWGDDLFDDVTGYASRSDRSEWPVEHLYGPTREQIWQAVSEVSSVEMSKLVDAGHHPAAWRHWPHLDGRIYIGANAGAFGEVFAKQAKRILHNTPEVLAAQEVRRDLRKIVLPLVHAECGETLTQNKPAMPGVFPANRLAFLYAAAPEAAIDHLESAVAQNHVKKLLRLYEPARKLIYQRKGRELRKRFYNPEGQDPQRLIRRLQTHTNWWVR
ncbi:MAG: hypothetical protein AAFR98_04585 [Pseudomonadota bacterium]